MRLLVLLCCIILGFTLPYSAGNFIYPDTPDYYAGGQLTITMTNLTVTTHYSLLAGANLDTWAHQWYNFTATDLTIDYELSFKETSLVDNTSTRVSQLQFKLYNTLTNSQLAYMWINVKFVENQLPLTFIGLFIASAGGSIVVVYIITIIIKRWIK